MIGPPGAGIKETTLKLSQHFESTTISVGDLLKKEVVKKTELGSQIEQFIDEFLYVPDSVVVEILKKYIQGLDSSNHIFIEGFPKTVFQAKYLISEGIIPDAIIFLNYPAETCLANLRWTKKNQIQELKLAQ